MTLTDKLLEVCEPKDELEVITEFYAHEDYKELKPKTYINNINSISEKAVNMELDDILFYAKISLCTVFLCSND